MYHVQQRRAVRGLLILLVLVAIPSVTLAQAPVQLESEAAVAASGWEQYPRPPSVTYYGVNFLDETEGWIVGQDAFIVHYVGDDWVAIPNTLPKRPLRAVDAVSSSDVWAVGWDGNIAHYNGSTWQLIQGTPDVTSLDDVHMIDGANGWAVGTGGAILRYSGGVWSQFPSPTTSPLKSLDMLGTSDGWAVGIGGVFVRWNGSSWQSAGSAPGATGLYGVDIVSSNDVWAVGGSGMILHYNGSAWVPVPSPTTQTLWAIEMLSADEGWAVGDVGTIIHYNGESWSLVDSPTNQPLYSLDMVSESAGWAVGKFGVILRYTGGPADLSTSYKQADKHSPAVEDEVEYKIVLKNSGVQPSSTVVVTDSLDLGLMSYVEGSGSISKGSFVGPNPLVATVPEILAGESVTFTFRVSLIDQAPDTCWLVPNVATVNAGDSQFQLSAGTLAGTCHSVYLPLVLR